MATSGVLLEAFTGSSTTIPQTTTMGSQSFGDLAAESDMNGGELLSATCIGATATAAVDATSGDPLGILVIFFKDTTPYSRTENRANHFYQKLRNKQADTDFPVVICEDKAAASAMEAVFGTCEKAKMVDTLNLLEMIINGECDA